MDSISPALPQYSNRSTYSRNLHYWIIVAAAIVFFFAALVILANDSNNNELASYFFLTSVFLFLLIFALKYGICLVGSCVAYIRNRRQVIPGRDDEGNESLLESSVIEKEIEASSSQTKLFDVKKASYGSTEETFVSPSMPSTSGYVKVSFSSDPVTTLDSQSQSKESKESTAENVSDEDTLVESGSESCEHSSASKLASLDSKRSQGAEQPNLAEITLTNAITAFMQENKRCDSNVSITSSYHTACSEPL